MGPVGKKNRAKKAPTHIARPSSETEGLMRFVQQLMQDRRYMEAQRAAQALVESDPLNPLAHAVLGSLLLQFERPVEAMRQFEMAIRLGMDNDPELLRGMAAASSMARFPVHALLAARDGLAVS